MEIIKNLFFSKRGLVFLVIIIAVVLGVTYFMGLWGKSTPEYKTVEVSKGSLKSEINASGTILSEDSATLSFLTSGRITALNFEEGDSVKKGQVIASLDSAQAADAVSKAQANYKSAQSALDKVLDDIHLYQYGMGGFPNIGSSNETQTQKTAREQAQMARDAAYQDLQSAQKNLEWSTIIAPFDGVISDISNIKIGFNATATTGSSVALVGTSKYKFKADVDEIEFRSLSASQSGEIILDAYPEEKFQGTISSIGVSAIKLSTGGSVVPVELTLANNGKLMNGLNGEVNFTTIIKDDIFILPKTAVKKTDGKEYVFLLIDKKPVKREITSGISLGNKVEVVNGLTAGDIVILDDVKQ